MHRRHEKTCVPRFLVEFSLLALAVCMPGVARSQHASSVLFISMSERSSFLYWPEGEKRTLNELKYSGYNVISADSDEDDGLEFRAMLEREAERNGVRVALTLYKRNRNSARMLIYRSKDTRPSTPYITYDYDTSRISGDVDAVALAAAEIVRAAMTRIERGGDDEDGEVPGLKTAGYAAAVAGIVAIGSAVSLHIMSHRHQEEANRLTGMYNSHIRFSSEITAELSALEKERGDERRIAAGFRIGAIAGYVLGGALAATAGVLFYLNEDVERLGALRIRLSPTGLGIEGEF